MSKLVMTNEQIAIIESLKTNNIIKVNAFAGTGKEQPYSEPILTPNGWTTMGELRSTDAIIGSLGNIINVTGIFEQGIKDVYNITFSDGTTTRCGADHLWYVFSESSNKHEVLSISELLDKEISRSVYDHRTDVTSQRYKFAIPLPNAIEFNHIDIPIDPYVLGVLLGDGGFSSQIIKLSNSNTKIINRVMDSLPESDFLRPIKNSSGNYTIQNKIKYKQSATKEILIKFGLNGKLSVEKHIPKEYLFNTLSVRRNIFKGLIDTDGYVQNKGNAKEFIEYSTSSMNLAMNVIELARGLGYFVSYTTRVPKFDYNGLHKEGKLSYRIYINTKKYKRITDITLIGKENSRCITVDAPDKLYVTSGYNLTHNTTTLYELTNAYPHLSFLYLSFGSELIKEAKSQFSTDNTEAKTTHAFALSHVRNTLNFGHRKNGLGNLMVHEIRNLLKIKNYKVALLLKTIFTAYCHSQYDAINEVTVKALLNEDRSLRIDFMSEGLKPNQMSTYMIMLWKLIADDKLTLSHDFYLKFFQLNIHYYNEHINYDVIMLDEAQDSNNVTLSIFNKFAGKKVIVGDKYQAIYGWRKATNVMEKIDADIDLALTTTFRFGQKVANGANNILQEVFGEKKTIVPFFPTIEKKIDSECRITRTNAALIRELDHLSESDKLVKTVRKPSEIFSMSLSVYYFQLDKWKYKSEITEKRLLQFKSTNEMKDHAKTMKDIELLIAIKLVDDYGERLLDLFDMAKINHRKRTNIDIFLTTAHTSKGKEWDQVTVADDFQDLLDIMLDAKIYSIADLRKTMKTNYNRVQHVAEEFNLFYVAITRGIVKVNVNSRNHRYLTMTEYELDAELTKMKDVRATESEQGWKIKARKKIR